MTDAGAPSLLPSPVCPHVAIVIVNWNGWPDTLACLASVRALDYPHRRIIVVDNASSDASERRIRAAFPDIAVLQAGANLGFAGGNNLGLAHALEQGADFVWLLNNDAVARPDALAKLVRLAAAHPDHDFFGSWIAYHDDPERLWFAGGVYRWRSGYIAQGTGSRVDRADPRHGEGTPTDWISGCSLLVRAVAVARLGLLDPSYFLYREELEWQLRRNPKHPRAMMVREPLVLHKVGRATETASSQLVSVFMSRNHLKLTKRYAGAATPLWLLRWFARYVLRPIAKRDRRALATTLRSVRALSTPGDEIVRALARPPHPRPSDDR